MNESPPILCVWACTWTGLWQRHQQLMSRLAAHHRILYVESPRDLFGLMRHWRQLRWRQLFGGWEAAPNIVVFTPMVPFSLRRYPRLNRIWLMLLRPWLRHLMRRWNCEQPILWVCYPPAEALVGGMGERLACYDCCDELADLSPRLARIIQEYEARLLSKVCLVFTSSETLFEKLAPHHGNVHLVPNGADIAHFAQASSGALVCPEELARLSHPLLGFVGAIQQWVNIELLAEVARKRPVWQLALIGSVHSDLTLLHDLPNVHILGPRPYDQLPAYLAACDVCLIPFHLSPFVLACDPIKAYEYLAAGKPVVATPIPRLRVFGDAIRVAEDADGFIAQIEQAMATENAAAASGRLALAQQHSWEKRVDDIEAAWRGLVE